eukprot:TRINITY_DN651_c4_g1_i1.p1 TRINITY_DN651_c4_g1~~TRINITY_DN651_c4_g1_i1.p1  ORF type:complete len:187 (-),score=14.13 TRINITY_DN651_c4_g1_i1:100-660(-)
MQQQQLDLNIFSRGLKLVAYFFRNPTSPLVVHLPHIFGKFGFLTLTIRLVFIHIIISLISGHYFIGITGIIGMIVNMILQIFVLGYFGGIVKLMSLVHFIAFGYPAILVLESAFTTTGFLWFSAVCSCLYYVPCLVLDALDLFQWFQGKQLVLVPGGKVYRVSGFKVDYDDEVPLTEMFKTARNVG